MYALENPCSGMESRLRVGLDVRETTGSRETS